MGLIPDPYRLRLHLVHVGLPGNITAIATQLDGRMRGETWVVSSDAPLTEFLARANYEMPAGTPVIRLDLTGEDHYFATVAKGPSWEHVVPASHIRPPLGEPRRYDGEKWAALRGWCVAPDVYTALAPSVGVVVEHHAGTVPPLIS